MRGILILAYLRTDTTRISPAHAGNTWLVGWLVGATRDQPRTCGEYYGVRRSPPGGEGSAPHMRGIPKMVLPLLPHFRISPAHAGNTASLTTRARAAADQPRTCGEYARRHGANPRQGGSAPHMRGIHFTVMGYSKNGGISPAHAGNTWSRHRYRDVDRDQPRTCGEYILGPIGGLEQAGSAPHMRGILAGGVDDSHAVGISPAHAGNTASA